MAYNNTVKNDCQRRKGAYKKMKEKDCPKELRAIKDGTFATVDEKGCPQARIIDVMLVDDERIYFCTSRGKDFHHQLMRDGKVAVAAMNDRYQMIRATGTAQKLDDERKWIDRIFKENPVMNDVYPGESRYVLDPFYVDIDWMEFFDLGKHPIYRETFDMAARRSSSGGSGDRTDGEAAPKGFHITDDCIGCGICSENCPQQCISEGAPYHIRQEHCLHCGLCAESCPAGAVVANRPACSKGGE